MANPGQRPVHTGEVDTNLADLREVSAARAPARIAAELYQARQRCGEDLRAVAGVLRIRYPYLVAIEEGRFEDLPGPTYVIGFLRSYAGYLGLDADEIVARFKAESSQFAAPQKLEFPRPPDEGHLPTIPLLAGALVLAVVVYGGYYVSTADRAEFERITPVPERLAERASALGIEAEPAAGALAGGGQSLAEISVGAVAPSSPPSARDEERSVAAVGTGTVPSTTPALSGEPTPSETAAVSVEPAVATATPAAVVEETPAPGEEAPAPATQPPTVSAAAEAEETRVAAARPEAAAQEPAALAQPATTSTGYVPRVYGRGNTDSRIHVRAKFDSWVQVKGARGELLLTRILRPGDVYYAPNRPSLVMHTGNAGALEITVDGDVAPPLGPLGAVRKNVALDPEQLLAGTAVSVAGASTEP
ncbi:MAG: RodZ domain-containing protein [Alphaproteobacteria bacterium]